MSMADRPPADPAHLVREWDAWASGEVLPGQTMANLKKAGLPDVLTATITGIQHSGGDASAEAALLDIWNRWERGESPPAPALEALRDAGMRELLDRARAAQEEVFGGA
ncbi:MAG TPA: hypothetical protein VHN98_06205 [Acidimicrobiales bacterium]|nr:hypothetical protein [Acidimicrobiales bacterium]